MAKQAAVGINEMVVTVLRTLLLDLPVVTAKRGFGMAETRAVTATAWKGYDASIRLGSASIDWLYGNHLLGGLLARSGNGLLRWQRLNKALTGAFFAGLWRATDLPTATEVNGLRDELRALAASLDAQGEKIEALIDRPVRSKAPESAKVTRSIAA
jgi:hypothetical protein